MAFSFNRCQLAGNLTRDPELKGSGSAICSFSIAVNEKWKGKDGQMQERVDYIDCTAFGKTGELIAEHLSKGSGIFIEGRLRLESWEKDGQKRSKLGVVVDTMKFTDGKPKEGGGRQQQEERPAQRPPPKSNSGGDDVPW